MNVIELDGSTGEGGGQILRTGLALSMCTGQPMVIQRIRAKRGKPGLMRQHLACVQAAVAVCGAQVEGAELGSQTLVFEPGAVRAGAGMPKAIPLDLVARLEEIAVDEIHHLGGRMLTKDRGRLMPLMCLWFLSRKRDRK